MPGVFQIIISILLLGFGGRDDQGRFLRKTVGTPKQMEIREKDRLRKQLNKPLNTLKKMAEISMKEDDFEYFSIFKTKNGDVFYTGTETFTKNFRDNKPILEFKEDMIESRRSSLVEKVLVQGAKKTAVRPLPNKKGISHQMSFLPGLSSSSISSSQKDDLRNIIPIVEEEDTVALDDASVVRLTKRTFTRQKRKAPAARAELMALNLNIEPTPGKKSRRGRGRGKNKV